MMGQSLKSFFVLVLFSTTYQLNGQQITPIAEIGKFADATSFFVSQTGFIYVSDKSTNEIYKLDSLGNELKSIGGYGWTESTFDEPSDIFSTTLNVYVTDKNNHRIQIFDKDLNFLSQFTTKNTDDSDYQFAYPVSSALSNQGDLYILDADNSRILKYNLTGDFLFEIGNTDAGDYSLSNPMNFAISPGGEVFVIENNLLFMFDQYGTNLLKINTEFEAQNISVALNKLLLNNYNEIKILDLRNISKGFLSLTSEQLNLPSGIIKSTISRNKLYLLTESKIIIYNLSNFGL